MANQRRRYDNASALNAGVDYLLRQQGRLKEGNVGVGVGVPPSAGAGTAKASEPTYLVASINARSAMRAQADFVCSGTDDDLTIQAALDALPTGGGRIVLTEGAFNISGAITVPVYSSLIGVGASTELNILGTGYTAITLEYKAELGYVGVDLAGVGTAVAAVDAKGGHCTIHHSLFVGMGQSGVGSLTYVDMSNQGQNLVLACEFKDIYNANIAVTVLQSRVVGSAFTGTGLSRGIEEIGSLTNEVGSSITGCSFVGALVDLAGARTAVTGNNFQQIFGASNNSMILITGSQGHIIGNNTFHGSFAAVSPAIIMSGIVAFINIAANTFYASGIELSEDGVCQQIVIDGNTFWEGGAIYSDSGAVTDRLQGVTISNNDWETEQSGGSVYIEFIGTARAIYDINIVGNSMYNQENTTKPLIRIDSAIAGGYGGLNLRVVGNKLSQESSNHVVHITGGGTGHGTVTVRDNDCEGSRGGIEVTDVREAVVKNNDFHPFPASGIFDSYSGQITVDTVNTAIVDGNSAVTGPYGDGGAVTGAVIFVSATDGGSVRDNDVWGENVAADLETAIEIDGPFWIQGNRYHGIHDFSVGAVFDNDIVVTGTGAIVGENGSPVDVSGATSPVIDAPVYSQTWSMPGVIVTKTGAMRFPFAFDVEILLIEAMVNTQPTGSSVISDVNVDASTVFTTPGDRPTIATSSNADSAVPNVTGHSSGSYVQVDVDQKDSNDVAADLTVTMHYRRA